MARQGVAWRGMVFYERKEMIEINRGLAWRGLARQSKARRGLAWPVGARRGKAWKLFFKEKLK